MEQEDSEIRARLIQESSLTWSLAMLVSVTWTKAKNVYLRRVKEALGLSPYNIEGWDHILERIRELTSAEERLGTVAQNRLDEMERLRAKVAGLERDYRSAADSATDARKAAMVLAARFLRGRMRLPHSRRLEDIADYGEALQKENAALRGDLITVHTNTAGHQTMLANALGCDADWQDIREHTQEMRAELSRAYALIPGLRPPGSSRGSRP